jgi:hypothetical protein
LISLAGLEPAISGRHLQISEPGRQDKLVAARQQRTGTANAGARRDARIVALSVRIVNVRLDISDGKRCPKDMDLGACTD